MSEQEMMQEIERLRRELETANRSRERLREIVCAILPLDPLQVMEKQIQKMMQGPVFGIEDIIADLRQDVAETPPTDHPISA
jgi:hypothetical protein